MRDEGGLETMKTLLEQLEETVNIGKAGEMKGKEGKELKMSERYNEDDADVTIISSDGVVFKVHSFLLSRASPVFKDMIGFAQSDSQRTPITLTDEFVELSLVFKATLDMLYDHKVATFKDGNLYHHVIEFARKWDMPTILETIFTQLVVHANTASLSSCVNQMFRLAIDLGDCELITAIMRAKEGNIWDVLPEQSDNGTGLFPVKPLSLGPPVLTPENEQYLKGGGVYRLGSWPYSKFAAIPTPIVWDLLRAGNTVNLAFRQHIKDALMTDFQKILESMYPKKTNKIEGGSGPSA